MTNQLTTLLPRRALITIAALGGLALVGCGDPGSDPGEGDLPNPASSQKPSGTIVQHPLQEQGGDGSSDGPRFIALSPQQTGISPNHTFNPGSPFPYLRDSGMEASGVSIGDIDGDGLPDLFLAGSPGNNRLYRQVGALKFEDITTSAGLDLDEAWSRGASMVDIDNDGDLDIYIANYSAANSLFINQGQSAEGKVHFVERAAQFGLDLLDASLMPSFCDYDHDGDLDLYVTVNMYHLPDKSNPPTAAQMIGQKDGKPIIKPPYDKFFRMTAYRKAPEGGFQVKWDRCGRPNHLFRNNGDGTFSNVTQAVGMEPDHGRSLSAAWWDYNEDGHPDLYVANDWGDRDCLYYNNGDGTFREAIKEAVPSTSMFTMGSDSGDLNNDGKIDFIAADMSGTTHYKRKVSMGSMQADKIAFMVAARPPQNMRNAVFLNTGTERLLEAAYLTGLANSDWSWAVKICDLDNDGLNDVFVTNGMEQNLRELEGTTGGADRKDLLKENNLAFRNQGDLKFVETGQDWGIGHFGYSTAAASSDFDRDGDLDLLVVNRDEPPTLYKNQSNSDGVLVRLHGRSSNRDGIGAVIKIETGSGRQVREIFCSRGYLGSDEAMAHFGLGADDSIKELSVAWPSGHLQTFTDLAGSSLYEITEPDGSPATGSPAPEPAGASPMFAPNRDLPDLVHVEQDYDDFAAQPLLPNKLSQLGPGIAVGDIDQDGDEDFILGGASGSQTQVVTSLGDGKYARPRPIPGTERFEDMGLVLLDCDGDGDRDLFVASGGVEGSGADLQDRLYLNDGSGSFSEAPADSLPAHRDSGGPVATADIDRDGDLDLFVGGRLIPGQYPLAAESRLLINQGGTFTTADFPSELGLVTGATFSDIDGDGWQDLLVAREWGPIAYLQNEEGQFSDRTEAAGLAGVSGWWNGIATGDVDNDGDIDLVASNFGLNTKYHASAGHPAQLFYGSFGTDKMRLVEAEFEGGELLPVRGKSCSTQAIPHLGEKFKTFHDFALADVREIYTQPALDDSTRFAATTLKSGVFLNDGDGQFEFSALPRLAQIAPGFGIVISELDGDGNPDLFLAQNFFQPQAETGRMSGGLSLVLTGTGSGRFEPVWPKDSGVIVPDDTTAAAVTDTNGDGWPDLLLASNNGPVHNLINRGSSESTEGRITRIVLRGQPGNPDGIGARVIAETGESRRQMAEVQSGSGYLSQSAPGVFFGGEIDKVTVRWPDGKSTVETVDSDKHTLVIDQP